MQVLGYLAPVLLLLGGAVLLTAGAEGFAEHVTGAASRLGVTVLALGLLLAGAEPEEAVTAMLASGRGHPALAAGDAVGANLVILTLTIGLAALLGRLPVTRRVVEYAVASTVAGAVLVGLAWNGTVGRPEGAGLVLLYGVGVLWVWRRERRPPLIGEMSEVAEEERAPERGARAVGFVGAGLLGMVAGGYLAVRGAEGLVSVLGVSDSVVGLTLLALATSAEMLALVWAAHRRGVSEIVLAGAVGSVAYNATVSVGLAALVRPVTLGAHSAVTTIGVVTAALPLVLLLGRRTGWFPRPVGVLLVACYGVIVGWLWIG